MPPISRCLKRKLNDLYTNVSNTLFPQDNFQKITPEIFQKFIAPYLSLQELGSFRLTNSRNATVLFPKTEIQPLLQRQRELPKIKNKLAFWQDIKSQLDISDSVDFNELESKTYENVSNEFENWINTNIDKIKACTSLSFLYSYNILTIPEEIKHFQNLKVLDISKLRMLNNLENIKDLPNLQIVTIPYYFFDDTGFRTLSLLYPIKSKIINGQIEAYVNSIRITFGEL